MLIIRTRSNEIIMESKSAQFRILKTKRCTEKGKAFEEVYIITADGLSTHPRDLAVCKTREAAEKIIENIWEIVTREAIKGCANIILDCTKQ